MLLIIGLTVCVIQWKLMMTQRVRRVPCITGEYFSVNAGVSEERR